MSLFGMQTFMYRLKREPALQDRLRRRDASAFDGFPMEEDERAAVLAGDIAGLFRRGVHPLLLTPYSRFVGISPAQYKQRMADAKGSRRLCS